MSGGLARRLGLGDAVFIGLGSMIGAGLFAAIGPAAGNAGPLLLVALALAGLVAFCNATSSAQLAARSPAAGGTYVYGRERLGSLWGYLAGWVFVAGKIASCAALARTFAVYALPETSDLTTGALAAAATLVLTWVNLRGVEGTARLTAALVGIVLAAIALSLSSMLGAGEAADTVRAAPIDLLRSAGLLFFAFAGYARIATLGEEVRDPERTITRAIPLALGLTLIVYALVAEGARRVLGSAALAAAQAPVAEAVAAGRFPALEAAARAGAVFATLSVLLSLIAGVSRTVLAMARTGDLPRGLSHVHAERRTPDRAEILVGIVVATVAATVDVRQSIGFSAFTILVYYAITNASALRLRAEERRWPRAVAVTGAIGCATLAVTLPTTSIILGAAVMTVGAAWFVVRRSLRPAD